MSFFKEYEEDLRKTFEDCYNISGLSNWKKNKTEFVTIYKLAKLSADYQEYKNEVFS